MIGALFLFSIGFIFYAYAGYPLVLFGLSRFKKQPQPYPIVTPKVTLIIAAYNEEAVIGTKLNNTLALDYQLEKLQIIVAADGSNDQTAEIVRTFADRNVQLNDSPERKGKMAALMRAMTLAEGEIVLFSDANNLYDPQTVRALVRPFADPTIGATTGAKSILKGDGALGDSEGLYWKYESAIKKIETKLGCCTAVAGEILAIRRDLFRPAPPEILIDDLYTALQIIRDGYRIMYVPQARSRERVSATARDEMTRRSRIITGRYQVLAQAGKLLPWKRPFIVWQIVSHKFVRPLVPFAMMGALVTSVTALLFPGNSWFHQMAPWFLGLQVLFYGLAVIGNLIETKGLIGKLLYIPTFLTNSNWAAVLGCYRFFTQHQTGVWQRVSRREGIGTGTPN